jgi:competence protein ComEC
MFKLRIGYLVCGVLTGGVLLYSFLTTLPDGKLHIVFCDVGQGDATYVRFADGRDMLVDGGPNEKVLACLGRHMPFWDRTINLVVLTHPQKDHVGGLASVLERYTVEYFLKSDVESDIASYTKLKDLISTKNTQVKLVEQGQTITIGTTSLLVVWPSQAQLALRARLETLASQISQAGSDNGGKVLGTSVDIDLNDYSVVLWVRYGGFDALLTGDADSHVQNETALNALAVGPVELLKVPHHGSKTAMTSDFLDALNPQLAVISVGKNTYGHPSEETIHTLTERNAQVMRTDQLGDIEIISDGKTWSIKGGAGRY